MMPVAGNSDQPESIDYKKKYKALKRKLKFLVYEHESFLEELKKAQRKLLKVSRDRSFLLDRLLQYEKVDDSSSDSEATASSDSEADGPKDGSATKKRKMSGSSSLPALPVYNQDAPGLLAGLGFTPTPPPPPTQPAPAQTTPAKTTTEPPKKRQKVTKKTPKSGASTTGRPTVAQALQQQQQQLQRQQQQQQQQQQQSHVSLAEAIAPGHMTREELERHLEYKQSTKPQFMSIDKAPNMLPDDIFNDDNSNSVMSATGK